LCFLVATIIKQSTAVYRVPWYFSRLIPWTKFWEPPIPIINPARKNF